MAVWEGLLVLGDMAMLYEPVRPPLQSGFGELFLDDASNRIFIAMRQIARFIADPAPDHLSDARSAWATLLDSFLDVTKNFRIDRSSDEPDHELKRLELARLVEKATSLKLTGQAGWAEIASGIHADRAEEAQKNAEKAAGEAATDTLTKHYDAYAKTQAASATNFRNATIAIVTAAIVLPLAFHALLPGSGNITDAIGPLVAAAGLFGLAGYFARQAHLHRTLATWAESIKIQLLTFEGFVSPVQSGATTDELRAAFANRVFGPQPKLKGEVGVTASSPIIDSIITKMPRQ